MSSVLHSVGFGGIRTPNREREREKRERERRERERKLNIYLQWKRTPLHHAATKGDQAIAELLLLHKADVNSVDEVSADGCAGGERKGGWGGGLLHFVFWVLVKIRVRVYVQCACVGVGGHGCCILLLRYISMRVYFFRASELVFFCAPPARALSLFLSLFSCMYIYILYKVCIYILNVLYKQQILQYIYNVIMNVYICNVYMCLLFYVYIVCRCKYVSICVYTQTYLQTSVCRDTFYI
jgi:hypothetical protein